MTKKLLLAATLVLPLAIGAPLNAHAGEACEGDAMPSRLLGICKTPLFKAYTSCIDKTIPVWDPNGPVLSKVKNFSPQSAVMAVLLECEPIAKKFGKKYGNDLAGVLQSVANQMVSERYGAIKE